MTTKEFNEKWSDYLEEGHYGLAIENPEVIEYLDGIFEDLTKLPGFQYSQIKWKWDFICFYAKGISRAMKTTIEDTIKDKASFDLIDHLQKQRKFSEKTFGPRYKVDRTEGILKHIAQEIKEVRLNPQNIEEWIDIVLLALDGAWRTGATDKEVVHSLADKLQINKSRKWPDWRESTGDDPINHDKTKD